jgi:hypothetical protein
LQAEQIEIVVGDGDLEVLGDLAPIVLFGVQM